jgi:hypothetical protein
MEYDLPVVQVLSTVHGEGWHCMTSMESSGMLPIFQSFLFQAEDTGTLKRQNEHDAGLFSS